MKQQANMCYLHRECGESLALSRGHRVSSLNRRGATTQKQGKIRNTGRSQDNEGNR